MKRLSLRITALVVIVVLGLIAYAYGQRGIGESSARDNTTTDYPSPLRVGAMQPIPPLGFAPNPLRDKPQQSRATEADSSQRNPGIDSRVIRVSNEVEDSQPSSDNAEQARYPELVGPGLGDPSNPTKSSSDPASDGSSNASAADLNPNSPPMVQRYPAGGNSSDRHDTVEKSPDRYANAVSSTDRYSSRSAGQTQTQAKSQEPGPFKADPFSEPTAISPSTDTGRDRFIGSNRGRSSESLSTTNGTGQPGSKQLEGPQTPQVTIQKFAPDEIQVGKPATFKITVRNTGSIPASQVEIHDQAPKGTKLLGTTPRASQGARGEIVWTLGVLRPGEESSVEMELMPTAEGEIGSVATVHIGADAAARTISTRPKLAVAISAPEKVLIGEQMILSITVSNPGTGVATGVVLENRIPPGLQHPAGSELEYDVGNLRPGESKKLDLPLAAVAPGRVLNLLVAHADANLRAEQRTELEVVAPKLDIALEGPKRRYLEREATYQVSVSNPGTAAAQQVELIAYLPPGLKFVSANNAGQYDEANRAVYWRLEELPSKESGSVELVTLPIEAGQHSIRLRGTADKGLSVEREQAVIVEGIAAILFQAVDLADPLEVGGETTYEVHVVNQGSKAASNVRLAVLLPPELQAVAAEG
ncbi:MAG TPA: hypothetical protein VIH42_00760, partial [Thermoguttaceae bacterium]